MDHVHRTFEPFKSIPVLRRFTWFPVPKIREGTRPVTFSVTHESDPPWRWAPTLVVRLWPLKAGLAVGWWINTDVAGLREEFQRRVAEESLRAEYDRYVAINGHVDHGQWLAARLAVEEEGHDPEDDLEIQMMLSGIGTYE